MIQSSSKERYRGVGGMLISWKVCLDLDSGAWNASQCCVCSHRSLLLSFSHQVTTIYWLSELEEIKCSVKGLLKCD